MERKSHQKYLCQDLRSAQIIVIFYPKNTIIFTITQAQRKSHRKYLRWDLRSTWIIVNIIVNFWSKFTIIWAERKSHRKYLRWDLRSTRIIVNIYDNISVNIYDNDLWLLTLIVLPMLYNLRNCQEGGTKRNNLSEIRPGGLSYINSYCSIWPVVHPEGEDRVNQKNYCSNCVQWVQCFEQWAEKGQCLTVQVYSENSKLEYLPSCNFAH